MLAAFGKSEGEEWTASCRRERRAKCLRVAMTSSRKSKLLTLSPVL